MRGTRSTSRWSISSSLRAANELAESPSPPPVEGLPSASSTTWASSPKIPSNSGLSSTLATFRKNCSWNSRSTFFLNLARYSLRRSWSRWLILAGLTDSRASRRRSRRTSSHWYANWSTVTLGGTLVLASWPSSILTPRLASTAALSLASLAAFSLAAFPSGSLVGASAFANTRSITAHCFPMGRPPSQAPSQVNWGISTVVFLAASCTRLDSPNSHTPWSEGVLCSTHPWYLSFGVSNLP
mmetsp:Transcript_33966/g.76753  ORF Transcript_33966/g.76753 Transcript_33966/m.76753 type:complete len:241 (-) Transcript_33966:140-862(-)